MRSYVIPQHSRASQALLEITCLCFILSTALSCEVRSTVAHGDPQKLQRIQAILGIIDSYYVDDRRVEELLDSVYERVFSSLDPHSFYLDPQETVENRNYYTECSEFGYGWSIVHHPDFLTIRWLRQGGPADKAGLIPGDKIEKIGGREISTLTPTRANYLLNNESTVGLAISRRGGKKRFEVQLEARRLPESTVGPVMMLSSEVGYVRLEGFIANTFAEFRDALRRLNKQGMKTLVLDMRDNGGGLLDVAHQCASLFLYSDAKLTAPHSRKHVAPKFALTKTDGEFRLHPLIVLVDRNTCSGGEVMSGILQDHDRGILIGQPTYGKGLVQQQFPLPDRGVFQMTVSRYLLPSGRCIQLPYAGSNYLPFDRPLVFGPNYDHRFDSLLPHTGMFYTEKGRRVYAGLGVIPDIVTPPLNSGRLVNEFLDSGALSYAVDEYLNYNGEFLKQKYGAGTFASAFEAKADLLKLITRKATGCGIPDAEKRIDQEQALLLRLFKEVVAERLFGAAGRFMVSRTYDTDLREALRLADNRLVLH